MRRPKGCMSKTGSGRLAGRSGSCWEAGAHVYVCGDAAYAAYMAAALEEALLEVITQHQVRMPCLLSCLLWQEKPCSIHDRCCCFAGRGGTLAANEYVEALRSASRYQRDVWYDAAPNRSAAGWANCFVT